MEKELKLTQIQYDHDSGVDELYLLINTDHAQPARNVLVDDERGIYLRLDLETDEIVGAMVFHADHWFEEIARAFKNHDFSNPDLRFFLEKKLESLASPQPNEPATSR